MFEAFKTKIDVLSWYERVENARPIIFLLIIY